MSVQADLQLFCSHIAQDVFSGDDLLKQRESYNKLLTQMSSAARKKGTISSILICRV